MKYSICLRGFNTGGRLSGSVRAYKSAAQDIGECETDVFECKSRISLELFSGVHRIELLDGITCLRNIGLNAIIFVRKGNQEQPGRHMAQQKICGTGGGTRGYEYD